MSERACGNPDCHTSTGIHEGLTFGHGRLDEHGFFEYPCRLCAAEWDKNIQETRDRIRDEYIEAGNLPLNVIQHILNQEWLWIPGWPRKGYDVAAHTREAQARFKKENDDDDEWNRLFHDVYSKEEGEAA